jgi:uncharacterized protein
MSLGMVTKIGQVETLFRYPVKSMGGEQLQFADVGFHGVQGDRRLALRRADERGGMPWLTAGRLPDLLLFAPQTLDEGGGRGLPTHVRTPDGRDLPIFGEELAEEIEKRHGAPVQMMHLRNGIFDEASISVIATDTVREIGRLSQCELEPLQFRPNVVVRLLEAAPFREDEWVGGVLTFGEGEDAPEIAVTMRDVRCGMVNLDPHTARSKPEVMKAIVRTNENHAGIYGTVTQVGRIEVGQSLYFCRGAARERLGAGA